MFRLATLSAACCLMAGAALAQGTPPATFSGGAGAPFSPHASNIKPGGNMVAPRLPAPTTASESPESLLRYARQALTRRQTGAAQQALEMAETRVLSRTVDPTRADQPNPTQMVQHIAAARRALGTRDFATAEQEIEAALAAPVPPPGPPVTVGPPVPLGPPTLVYPARP